jgi:hypothetical protein
MKVRKVEYSQLFSFGNFQNETIGYIVDLEEDEKPSDVISYLKQMTEKEHNRNLQQERITNKFRFLEKGIENELESLEEDYRMLYDIVNQSELSYQVQELKQLEQTIGSWHENLDSLHKRKDEIVNKILSANTHEKRPE